jgi:SAM-dependent methyltransferase
MSDITTTATTEPLEDTGDQICIVDPGGEDRATVPVTDADHTPSADPDAADRVMAPVADALLASAALRSGEHVLDLGCGGGATTIAAADTVGPEGSVYGIDVTPDVLEIARSRADSSAKTNVTLVEDDAQTHVFPVSFDVAISRFGTMFFPDPVGAFRNVAGALRPGGRLCIATWRRLEANLWLAVPGAALLRWITLPDLGEDGPGMFSQSDPDVVTATLQEAGYTDVRVEPVSVSLPLGDDPAEAANHLADTGVGRTVLGAVGEAQRPEALAAVRAALADHAGPDGVRLGAGVWITTAVAP